MKKIFTFLALLLIVAGCVYVPPDRPAPGPAPSDYCDEYARTAVDQSNENRSRGCGFSGVRWSTHYNEHYNWCRRVARGNVESERRARNDQLRSCRSSGGGSGSLARCRNYAREAVEQNRKNLSYGCGFTGGRWHSNENRHYNWCRSATVGQANNESRARNDQLRSCRSSGGGSGSLARCRNYARKAVAQNQENRRYSCGFTGGRWHSNENRHYNWCRSATVSQANHEKQARREALRRCH